MKTIESCEMSSSPSPPRLEDPDLIKMSKNEIEKTVEKNGFKEDKITKEDTINGSLSENEEKQKSEKIETTNGDQSEVKENGIDTEVKENGMNSEVEKESEEMYELMKNKIQKDDQSETEKADENSDKNENIENANHEEPTEVSSEESSKNTEEDITPMEEDSKSSENVEKSDSQSVDKSEAESDISEEKQESKELEKSESMEVDTNSEEDSKKEVTKTTSSESENKEPEKKDFEMPTKEPPKADISFDLSKIPVDLIEKRRAEEEKRKSAELKSKPVANLELVNASDSDSENEDSETKSDKKEEIKEEIKDDLNYNEALENLTKIQQESKKINDDELVSAKTSGGALKRPASTENDKEVKKAKLELENAITKKEIKDEKPINDQDIKKHLKQLTREQLENVVTEKIAEVISARSEIGDLRRKVDSYEQENERWKKKQQILQKMCMDLNTVMKRFIVDKQNQSKEKVAPIKITRSVGLQVVTDRQRRSQGVTAPKVATAQAQQVVKAAPRPILPAGTNPQVPARSSAVKTVNGLTNRPTVVTAKAAQPLTQMTPTSGLTPVPSPTTINNSNATRLHTLPASVSIIQTPTASSAAVTSTAPNKAASPATGANNSRTTPSPAGAQRAGTATNAKAVIDIVDLSDDEDQGSRQTTNTTMTPVQRQQPSNGIRLVPASQLRQVQQVNRPGGGTPTYVVNNSMGGATYSVNPRPLVATQQVIRVVKHPAPLPDPPRHQITNPSMKGAPPRPTLKISRLTSGIVLSWNMTLSPASHAIIASYQIYAYQETPQQKAEPTLWKKVGDVKALALPMACTLTQFLKGNKYHFAVRAKDVHTRVGHFSDPQSIALT